MWKYSSHQLFVIVFLVYWLMEGKICLLIESLKEKTLALKH